MMTTVSTSTPVTRVLSALEFLGLNPKPCANGWEARCPAHEDKTASFSLSQGGDGRALIKCHAECEVETMCARMSMEVRELFVERQPSSQAKPRRPPAGQRGPKPPRAKQVATYDYTDALGQLVFQVVRLDPKEFRQRRPDPQAQGGWSWNLKGLTIAQRSIVYRLPRVLEQVATAGDIYVVEGEKDVATLESWGLVATCNAGGAGKWNEGHTGAFRGGQLARVIVLFDKDHPGRLHGLDVSEALFPVVGSVRLLELLGPGKDVTDWASAGGTRAQLEQQVARTPDWKPPAKTEVQPPAPAETTPPPEATPTGSGQGEPPAEVPLFTDTWLAELFVKQHGHDLRFCGPWRKWLVFYKGRWLVDQKSNAPRMLKATVRSLYLESAKQPSKELREGMSEFAVKSESEKSRRAAITLSAAEKMVQLLPAEMDINPWILNLINGTLNLKTGAFQEHRREDLLTKRANVAFDKDATAPTWLAFLERIFAGDQEMIGFVQRAAGYSLTAEVGERALFVAHGNGANGKSTFCEMIQELLAEYACPGPPNFLVASKHERHPAELASLFGKRLVVCQESGEEHRFDEPKVKLLTGGDAIQARRMREDFWSFFPTHKIWLCTNHKPTVRGQDDAIWDRIKLIPFEVRIPAAERDPGLKDKLRPEFSGILNWCLAGCLAWQQKGLQPPEKVLMATAAYRGTEDRMGAFLEECCTVAKHMFVTKAALYEAFKEWSERNGEFVVTKKKFGQRMQERGFNADGRDKDEKDQRVWFGIGLRSERDFDTSDRASA